MLLIDEKDARELPTHSFEKVAMLDDWQGGVKRMDGADDLDDHLEALDELDLRDLVFGVPFRGSIPAFLGISSVFLIPALGQGLLISALSKNQFVASQVALIVAFLPAMVLSGFVFEIGSMPKPIQIITHFVPARYLIPSLQTVFMVGDLWGLYLRNSLILLGFGVVFFLLAIRATRRRLD